MRLAMATIFDPLTFRNGLTAPNRVVLAPMTNQQSHDDGTLSDEEFSWLMSRAKGGFGFRDLAEAALHSYGCPRFVNRPIVGFERPGSSKCDRPSAVRAFHQFRAKLPWGDAKGACPSFRQRFVLVFRPRVRRSPGSDSLFEFIQFRLRLGDLFPVAVRVCPANYPFRRR